MKVILYIAVLLSLTIVSLAQDKRDFVGLIKYQDVMLIKDDRQRYMKLKKLYIEDSRYARYIMAASIIRESWLLGEMADLDSYLDYLEVAIKHYEDDWNYNNAWHLLYTYRGIVALSEGDQERASEFLLISSDIKDTTPQLEIFGPDMTLAELLLEVGEKMVVLDYLEATKIFWLENNGRIDAWVDLVKQDKLPDFGLNSIKEFKEIKVNEIKGSEPFK